MDGISIIPAGGSFSTPLASASPARQQAQEAPEQSTEHLSTDQILQASKELETVAMAFDRRMEFKYHRELDTVVVKVIDRQTDKLIKELPPAELQRVHLRIREAVGLLIDEQA